MKTKTYKVEEFCTTLERLLATPIYNCAITQYEIISEAGNYARITIQDDVAGFAASRALMYCAIGDDTDDSKPCIVYTLYADVNCDSDYNAICKRLRSLL